MSDIKYVRSSINLLNVFDFKCISVLLKNNVKIYGNFLSSVIFNRQSIYKYLDNGGLIKGWALKIYKEIIERDLFEFTIHIKEDDNTYINTVLYTLDMNGLLVQIKIIYIDDLGAPISNECLIRNCDVFLDCNILKLDRMGLGLLFIPKMYKNCPNPFYKICRNIEKKQLNVLEDSPSIKNKTLLDLYSYINYGWSIKSNIKKIKDANSKQCSLCHTAINGEAFQLPCKHYYHRNCWINDLELNNKISQKIECAVCTYNDKSWLLLS